MNTTLKFNPKHPFDFSLTTRFKAAHVLEYLRPSPGDKILDIGCGLGFFLNTLARRGVRGFGMDFSQKSLTLAKGMTSGLFAQGDAQVLPYRDNSFDKIIFTDVIEHVFDDRAALQEIVRISKPGAMIALVTPGIRGRLANTSWRTLYHDEEGTPEYDERPGYTPEELTELMRGAGISVRGSRQTLILLGEFFLQLTKWVLAKKKVHYQTQGDILAITEKPLFRFYSRCVFPLFWAIGRLEERILSNRVDGHSLIMLGVVEKEGKEKALEKVIYAELERA
ncbi:MAG: methyltransferase domain-containing protein [Candidatus Latescibacterota bacterium]|nr:methyltransferase domain-containing protein [Candidatus Latescibacterota bacterium]